MGLGGGVVELALAFAEHTTIPNVALVFDRSSHADKERVLGREGGMKMAYVKSASRAGFATSDDALVSWIGKLKQEV